MAAPRRHSDEDIRLMRQLFAERQRLLKEANKLTYEKIAEKFNISPSNCRDIVSYQTYRNVLD